MTERGTVAGKTGAALQQDASGVPGVQGVSDMQGTSEGPLFGVWRDLVGQEAAVTTLQHAAAAAHEIVARARGDEAGVSGTQISNDPASAHAMTHAWLLCGPPGSGRSLAGRAFAAALECENGTGCGECKGCRTAMKGIHPDVSLVATERVMITIDEVAELVANAAISPSQGRWRVIVIEDADRMQERTTNLLLKSIEEPTERTVWVLCAPSPQDLLPTIRSRCRIVQLRVPPAAAVAQLLQRRYDVSADVALAAAQHAQSHIGSARHLATIPEVRQMRAEVLALPTKVHTVADVVVAVKRLVELTKEQLAETERLRSEQEIKDLVAAYGYESVAEMPAKLRTQVRNLESDQKRRSTRSTKDIYDRALVDLLGFYRDVLLQQLGAGTVEPINADFAPAIAQLAASTSAQATLARMEAIQTARERISGTNASPPLALEAMMLTFRPDFAATMKR